MLIMQSLILQFQILKFLVLTIAIALEHIGEIVDPLSDLFVQFLKLCLSALLQLFQLHLQLALLLSLRL